MPGQEADPAIAEVLAEAHQSRGASDDKLYATRSGDFSCEPAMLGTDPYRTSTAEFMRMPTWAQNALLAQRARRDARWAAQDAKYSKSLTALERWTKLQNRAAALKTVEQDGLTLYFTLCACSWCGLCVQDPEVARREYDEHACAITGDTHIDRAIATVDREQADGAGKLIAEKRTPHEMQVQPAVEPVAEIAAAVAITQTDDTEQRFALLELK